VEQMHYQRLLQFFMGLNDSYSPAREQILMMHNLPNVNQAYALVIQDESQKGIAGDIGEGMDSLALYTARSNTPQQFHPKPRKNYQNLFCDFYSMRGHVRADCNKLKKCDHCHVTGHIKENCFLLIGYPENFKGKRRANAVLGGGDQHFQQQSSQDHALLEGSSMMQRKAHTAIGEHKSTTQEQLLQLMHDSSPEQLHQMIDTIKKHKNIMDTPSSVNMAGTFYSLKWIIDTGATDHMINNPNYLHVKTKVGGVGKVQLPTGDLATVSHVGNLQLSENDVISEVLCIPAFKFNLLSVNKLTKELNCCVSFFPTHCVFQDLLSGKVKVIGEVEDGLYVLHWTANGQRNNIKTLTIVRKEDGDSILWHQRLGHVPMGVLRKIKELHVLASFTNDQCTICP